MSYECEDEEGYRQWQAEHDFKIIWECPTPNCGFEYEEIPDCNENGKCPDCGAICRKAGESYT